MVVLLTLAQLMAFFSYHHHYHHSHDFLDFPTSNQVSFFLNKTTISPQNTNLFYSYHIQFVV